MARFTKSISSIYSSSHSSSLRPTTSSDADDADIVSRRNYEDMSEEERALSKRRKLVQKVARKKQKLRALQDKIVKEPDVDQRESLIQQMLEAQDKLAALDKELFELHTDEPNETEVNLVGLLVPTPEERISPPDLFSNGREGQAEFRTLILNAYQRCAISDCSEKVALDAAHIIPYVDQRSHLVENGICLRADLHRLFDCGLISVDSNYIINVSPTLRDRSYQRFDGCNLSLPQEKRCWPDKKLLAVRQRYIRI